MATDSKDDENAKRLNEDLVETEDLLAGFDRPGRTPRAPVASRDFVDYHLDKRRPAPAPAPRAPSDAPRSRDLPTAIIPHTRPRWRAWLPWILLLTAMPAAGLLVAAFLDDATHADRPATVPSSSFSATSVPRTSSAPTPPPNAPPTPAPSPTPGPASSAEPAPVEAPRRPTPASSSTTTTPSASPSPSAAPSGKAAPNGDFIRVL